MPNKIENQMLEEMRGKSVEMLANIAKDRIAQNFPDNLNKIIDKYFAEVIEPEIRVYLDSKKEDILAQIKVNLISGLERLPNAIKDGLYEIIKPKVVKILKSSLDIYVKDSEEDDDDY